MKSVAKNIVIILIIGLVLFIGAKGCFFEAVHFDNDLVARQIDAAGEEDKIYLLKGNTIIMKKSFSDKYEYAIFNVKGTSATHYFGPFYNTGETLLSFKIYRDAIAVWKTEMKLTKKSGNLNVSTFGNIDEIFRNRIIIRKKSIDIANRSFTVVKPTDDDLKLIGTIKNKIK